MNKRVTLKLRRRILALAMAFVLVMTSVVTIPELGMKAQATSTVDDIVYGVTITGGTGALVDEFEFNLEYKTTIAPYDGTQQIRLKCDPITDDTLRFKQWNVLVQYGTVVKSQWQAFTSYSEVIKDSNFFNGVDSSQLDFDGKAALRAALKNDTAVSCKISISAKLENKYAAISFDGNGATSGSMEGTSIEKDTKYTLPTCGFTKDHHQFAGWKLDDTHVYQPGAEVTITEDTTFTADWKELFDITLSANPAGCGFVTG
ncbi:MAG: InlB B-repeat-containing protein, partial [Lachnospiraceae bacterium]|nr:InlB B-repeat-containing protein [Lachnospiraceae bacterium]